VPDPASFLQLPGGDSWTSFCEDIVSNVLELGVIDRGCHAEWWIAHGYLERIYAESGPLYPMQVHPHQAQGWTIDELMGFPVVETLGQSPCLHVTNGAFEMWVGRDQEFNRKEQKRILDRLHNVRGLLEEGQIYYSFGCEWFLVTKRGLAFFTEEEDAKRAQGIYRSLGTLSVGK
jgi:hypothetical protein